VRAKNACDRSYKVHLMACVQECVCEMGLYARTNASEFKCRPVYAIERTGHIRSHACKVKKKKNIF
jgi:hypothetical protein